MKTEHIFYCIFCVLMFASCSGGDHERQLERFEEMNRTDVPLCVDSVQPLVRHYDHWWHSRNHRMRAYYMLGCAYRDQGEAPAAIHYYNIATEQADTTNKNCDYATLFRVYGQMAMIYGQQNMPQEELEAWKGYSHYSFLAGDTINGALGYVYIARAFYAMDDTLAVLHFTDKARRIYLEHGDKEGAARVYPTAIYISLLNGNYPRARKFMDIFEGESNLFDEEGNIAPGREQYYNSKGLYCIGTGKLDSAEYYFRKLMPYGYNLEVCEGLLSIYENRRNADSIIKYARLYQQAQVQWAGTRQSEAIILSSSLYDYTNNQYLAELKTKQAEIAWFLFLLTGTILIISLLILYIGYYSFKERELKKEETYNNLESEYENTVNKYKELTKEFSILAHLYEDSDVSLEIKTMLKEKQAQIEALEKELGWQKDLNGALNILDREAHMKEEDIARFFEHKTKPQKKWEAPSESEWIKLMNLYKEYMPLSHACIINLPRQEKYTCILTHMGYTTGSIALLLETSTQSITNAKRKANIKLAGEGSSRSLLQNLRKIAQGVK